MWVLIYERFREMLDGGDVHVFATRQDAENHVIAFAQETYEASVGGENAEDGEPRTFEDAEYVLRQDDIRVVLVERDMMRSE